MLALKRSDYCKSCLRDEIRRIGCEAYQRHDGDGGRRRFKDPPAHVG